MKVAITTVGSKGPEDESKNEGRLKAGKLAMAKAKSLGADILRASGKYITFTNLT